MKYRFQRLDDGREFTLETQLERFEDGQIIERVSKIDGTRFKAKCIGVPRPTLNCPSSTYPMWSDNMGINPDQIPEAVAADRAAGFNNIEYHPETGAIRFPDRGTRKRYCEHHFTYDRNGCASDPQRYDRRERAIRAGNY